MSKSGHIVVKYKDGKNTFEVLAKPGKVVPYREGKLSLDNAVVAEEIFSNSSKFQKAKTSDLKKTFGTEDKNTCLEKIMKEGVFPLTKDEINQKVKEKRTQILNYLVKYYHDPKGETTMPHPMTRMESALETMRYKVDPDVPVNIQIKEVVKKLPDILPVKPMDPPHLAVAKVDAAAETTKPSGRNNKKGGKKGGKNR